MVGGGCQKKIEGCVSNAKPNVVSKTKLKILPLNLPRQSHKETGQGHLESWRKISPTLPSQIGFHRSCIPVSGLEMSTKPSYHSLQGTAVQDRCGTRKERGKSLPFLQEPTLEKAEKCWLLSTSPRLPLSKVTSSQLLCAFAAFPSHAIDYKHHHTTPPILLMYKGITSSFGLRLWSTMSNRGYAFLSASMVTTCLNPRLSQTIKESCGDWFFFLSDCFFKLFAEASTGLRNTSASNRAVISPGNV